VYGARNDTQRDAFRPDKAVNAVAKSRINKMDRRFLLILILIVFVNVAGQSQIKRSIDPEATRLGFNSNITNVNGVNLHFVYGGKGRVVMLLHGFPEDWYAYHNIMPRLAKKFTVIAVDLRGVGHSEVTPDGYDAANMSEDIFQLAQDLDSPKFYLVGHDVGGMVAYALARRHPEILRGVMILETPLQGIDVADEVNARLWHIGFQQMPDLPEKMIAGREAIYFREAFFNTGTLNHQALSDADVRRYSNSY
jgi:pimeloyl-ACP methyl ester carboxylesterase